MTIKFTTTHLEDYYNNRFHKDLYQFFRISKKGNIDEIVGFNGSIDELYRIFHPIPSIAFYPTEQGVKFIENPKFRERDPQKKNEEEILFVALLSFMFSAEKVIAYQSEDFKESELALCMNAFGFPWLKAIHRMGLVDFLTSYSIKSEFYRIEEVEMLRDAMSIVEPFMLDKLINFLKTWENGAYYLKNAFVDNIGEYIGSEMSDGIVKFHLCYYKYEGLLGLTISHKEYENYKNQFFTDFKKYFSCAKEKDGYLKVLAVHAMDNHRWENGNPGGTGEKNLIFASIFLYMTMAQRSFLKYAEEAEEDFHKCTGWPKIGANPYLHPLVMLEYAGLSPLKHESLILLEYVKTIFRYIREEINAVLNGTESAMKDIHAGKRMLDAIRVGHKRANIRRYLDKEEAVVKDLLVKWTTHPNDSWYTLLEKEGIPLQQID